MKILKYLFSILIFIKHVNTQNGLNLIENGDFLNITCIATTCLYNPTNYADQMKGWMPNP